MKKIKIALAISFAILTTALVPMQVHAETCLCICHFTQDGGVNCNCPVCIPG
jgi:hypothetical protein